MAMRCGIAQGILDILRSLVRARETVSVAGEDPLVVQERGDEGGSPPLPYPPDLCKYRPLCLYVELAPRESATAVFGRV